MSIQLTQKKDVQNFYNKIAGSYDELYSEEQRKKFELASSLVSFKFNGKILDAGCGTGLFEVFLGKESEEHLIFGIDISRGVLDEAKKKFSGKPNIFLICGDVDCLPFPEKLFDSCVLFTVLHNLPNPEKTLNEIRRVIRKDALVVVTYLKVKASFNEFKSLIRKVGVKGDFLDHPAVNEYIFVGRVEES